MKNLIKIVGLLTCTILYADGSVIASSAKSLNTKENTTEGFKINSDDEIINHETKTLFDVNRPVGGTSIRYYSSTAIAMQTSQTTIENGYVNASKFRPSCTRSLSESLSKDDALDLPSGSKIISLSAFGIDNNDHGYGVVQLSEINGAGNYSIKAAYSSGIPHQPGRFNIGGFLDYTPGSYQGALVRLISSHPDIELCGFRIGYVPPDVANDVIFVTNFYR